MEIVKAKLEHIKSVYEIAKQEFDMNAWSYDQFLNELSNENRLFLVAICDGEVVGYITSLFLIDEMELLEVAVKEEYKRKGIASALLNKTLQLARKNNIKKCFLEVYEHNNPALTLYQNFNFKPISNRKNYYNNGKNAIIMELLWIE